MIKRKVEKELIKLCEVRYGSKKDLVLANKYVYDHVGLDFPGSFLLPWKWKTKVMQLLMSKLIESELDLKPDSKLLDMGAGTAGDLLRITDNNPLIEVIGIEVSWDLFETVNDIIDATPSRRGRAVMRPVPYTSTGTPEGYCDRYLFSESIRYSTIPDLEETLREVDKISSDDDILVINDFFINQDCENSGSKEVVEYDNTRYHHPLNLIAIANRNNYRLVSTTDLTAKVIKYVDRNYNGQISSRLKSGEVKYYLFRFKKETNA